MSLPHHTDPGPAPPVGAPEGGDPRSLLDEVLAAVDVGVAVLDPDFRVVCTSPAWDAFLGPHEEDLRGQDLRQLLASRLRSVFAEPEDFVDAVLASYARGDHCAGRECRISAAGERRERWLEYRSRLLPAGGRIESFTDVTRRKRAEAAVAEIKAREGVRAEEAEEKYQQLFEQSKDMVFVSTPDGRLIDVNPAGVELLGHSIRAEALRTDVIEYYVDPGQRQVLLREVAERGYVKDFELQLKTWDGRLITALCTASAIRDDDGEVVHILGIMRDATQHRQLEEQLRQSQKMEAIGRLAGGLAHDFNNLLTVINGYSELLERQTETEPQRHYVDGIREAGQRAAELTAKLLAVSRRQVSTRRVAELRLVIENLKGLMQKLIGEDIELVTDLDPRPSRVKVDLGQIEQLLLNLAVNARDAMPTGGRLAIATENLAPHEIPPQALAEVGQVPCTCLAVTDTGIGIDPEIADHIFEPFFTTKDHGKGSGIGLSTVYATVIQCRGHIEVESAPGAGTTFRIYFPLAAEEAAVRPAAGAPEQIRRGHEQILLVEDDAAVRLLVQDILEHQGYSVLAAEDGAAAMRLVDESQSEIDLLVSDVVMPGMSGPELAVRLARRFPQMRMLFISGYTASFISRHGLSEDYHRVLRKPFDSQMLAERVREVLDGPALAAP